MTQTATTAQPERAVLYLRINYPGGGLRGSALREDRLRRQLALCTQAAHRLHATIVHEYIEYGSARADLGRRMTLLDMLGDLMLDRSVNYLIIPGWPALSRHIPDLLFIAQTAHDAGAAIVNADDGSNPARQFHRDDFCQGVAEHE